MRLLKTRLFDLVRLQMDQSKRTSAGRVVHYPLYPKGYKGVEWTALSRCRRSACGGPVSSGRNARSFLPGSFAHCPQAPPLPFGASGYPPRRPARGPEAEGGAATHAAKRLFYSKGSLPKELRI